MCEFTFQESLFALLLHLILLKMLSFLNCVCTYMLLTSKPNGLLSFALCSRKSACCLEGHFCLLMRSLHSFDLFS